MGCVHPAPQAAVVAPASGTLAVEEELVAGVEAAVAVVVGGLTVLWLMQYDLSIDLIGWIVFIEMTIIIGLGVVRPGGKNLFSFLLSSLKPDTRYFCREEEEFDNVLLEEK
jgi:hypothetical protein